MIDLALVSEDELWEEIKKRNCSALLVTLKTLDGQTEERKLSYCGGRFTCIGLAEYASNKILKDAAGEE